MTKEELAKDLDGMDYPNEPNNTLLDAASKSNLLIVFGASDDLIEFRGAVDDEAGGPGKVYIKNGGLVLPPDCDCEYAQQWFKDQKEGAIVIEALWCDEKDISWTYKTDLPHATFRVVEDGDVYCRGIVVDLN